MRTDPLRITTCTACDQQVGAHHDQFTNHRSALTKPIVWKTVVHKAEGKRCPGSRLSVPTTSVIERERVA